MKPVAKCSTDLNELIASKSAELMAEVVFDHRSRLARRNTWCGRSSTERSSPDGWSMARSVSGSLRASPRAHSR